jgi:hypothetical protein
LEALFRYEVLKMLKAEGKISDAVIENMVSWRHSGINVYCGPTFWPNNDQGLEDISRHIQVLSMKKAERKPRRRLETPSKTQAEVLSAFGHRVDISGVLQQSDR